MKRNNRPVRLWAAAFWLLVWQGASMALAGTTGMGWRKYAMITLLCRPLMILAYSLGALGLDAVFPWL